MTFIKSSQIHTFLKGVNDRVLMNSIFLGQAIIVIADPTSVLNCESYKPLQEIT